MQMVQIPVLQQALAALAAVEPEARMQQEITPQLILAVVEAAQVGILEIALAALAVLVL